MVQSVKSAEQWLQGMTLEQKIGQMICVRAFPFEEKVRSTLASGTIGAVGSVLLLPKFEDVGGLVSLVNDYLDRSPVPLLFFSDAERGVYHNLKVGTSFPSMMALGATFSSELAYRMGWVIAKEARSVGFGMICNPVLDVNSNPDNPIISTRAMSDSTDLIIELGAAYIEGMQEAGVIPNGKHFPGHGDTRTDSHIAMPIVEHSREYLMEVELKPFRELIRRGMTGIMTAHILYPALAGEGEEQLPATLSRTIMTGLLREQFGFDGLIVSDSLTMKSIKDQYGIEKAAVMAVQAGNDIILQDYQSDPELTFRALLDAVRTGELSLDQIDDSVRRILQMKERFGLLSNARLSLEEAKEILQAAEHVELAKEIAGRSITVLEKQHLPLRPSVQAKTLLIATRSIEEGKEAEDMGTRITGKSAYFLHSCSRYSTDTDIVVVNENPTEQDRQRVLKALTSGSYEHVMYGAFVRVISYKEGSGTIPGGQFELIRQMKELHPELILLIFGSPYILRQMERLSNCICAYSDCDYSIDAALDVVFGARQAEGRLPVSVNEAYPFGHGL
ncbi:glycoside hydrolase family 3 protein [Paenibacillus sp. GD4]|uniref:glycoside hydrolase family 3 protein n=1 Tax=Paenibacillus sp. GD4 TaxID=3068890 RepID=UPI002796E225|nr:glycoside hydrolase family 3 protein [Paenibacillus sp. GD4]MDQ1914536.1 glycoside hydrolase family 3 protein [Paenibacillus sp. GD4]